MQHAARSTQHAARADVLVRAMPDAAGEGHGSLFNDFACVRKPQQIAGRYRDAHRSQDWPSLLVLARGQQSACSFAALPKGLPCKSGICRVANARRAARPFLFRIPFFVPCALQLLPLQGKAHDVKPLNRLLGGRRQSVCTHGHALCQGAHQFVAQRASGCGYFVNGQHGAVAGLSPQRDFAAQARLPMWRML